MTLPENAPTEPLESPLVRPLGHVSVERDIDHQTPFLDIRIDAIEQPEYAPTGAQPYEGPAKRGLNIHDSDSQAEEATSYARTVFPDSTFSFLSSGRYGVVLADDTGKAFKIYRSALCYSRYEKEAGALQLLSAAGLAPKLHLLVDAGQEYRLDYKSYDYDTFGFEDVQIPRQNSGNKLPVLVMDRIDVEPLESAEPNNLIDGFCNVADVFMREGIYSWDAEVMTDKATGKIIILDVGELYQRRLHSAEGRKSKLERDLEVLRSLAMDFGLSKIRFGIENAFRGGGMEAVRDILAQHIHNN